MLNTLFIGYIIREDIKVKSFIYNMAKKKS